MEEAKHVKERKGKKRGKENNGKKRKSQEKINELKEKKSEGGSVEG